MFFGFRLNIFANKIVNLLLPLTTEDAGGCESWHTVNLIKIVKTCGIIKHCLDIQVNYGDKQKTK